MLVYEPYLSYCLCDLQSGEEAQHSSDLSEIGDKVRHADVCSAQEIILRATHRQKIKHFTNNY